MKKTLRLLITTILLPGCLAACSAGTEKQQMASRQKTAMAMFAERCKKAGEFILRTVDGVDGILLLKVRPPGINDADQFKLDDPYGRDFAGEGGFIESFLRGSYRGDETASVLPRTRGYLYVEAVDANDGVRYRYTGSMRKVTRPMSVMNGGDGKTLFTADEFSVQRTVSSDLPPRYAITYDDISTTQDRNFWIAGSSLKVIDLQSNEVIAERVGYMFDLFQGSRAGARSPWLLAADHSCPSFGKKYGASAQAGQTDRFAEKVLKPIE